MTTNKPKTVDPALHDDEWHRYPRCPLNWRYDLRVSPWDFTRECDECREIVGRHFFDDCGCHEEAAAIPDELVEQFRAAARRELLARRRPSV